MTAAEREGLASRYAVVISDYAQYITAHAAEIDPDSLRDWFDLTYGYFIARVGSADTIGWGEPYSDAYALTMTVEY